MSGTGYNMAEKQFAAPAALQYFKEN